MVFIQNFQLQYFQNTPENGESKSIFCWCSSSYLVRKSLYGGHFLGARPHLELPLKKTLKSQILHVDCAFLSDCF